MSEMIVRVGPSKARVTYWLGRGWDWFVEDPGTYILIGVVAVLIIGVSQGLLWGPVMGGFAWAGLQSARLSRVQFSDFLDGFKAFLAAFLSGLLILLFSLVGLIFLIVPGLVIFSMYLFTFHFIVDRKQDFWEAMESSRHLVSRDYFGFSVFALLILLINLLGLFFLGVGTILTIGVTSLAVTVAYLECTGSTTEIAVPDAEPIRIE